VNAFHITLDGITAALRKGLCEGYLHFSGLGRFFNGLQGKFEWKLLSAHKKSAPKALFCRWIGVLLQLPQLRTLPQSM
jgi:hypothetical protein